MTTPEQAKDFAIVMGYEAMRICTQGRTEKAKPADVMRWMRLMLKQQRPAERSERVTASPYDMNGLKEYPGE